MKVWLDDRRTPPDPAWVWVHTPEEAIELLRSGEVEALSVDHDLGLVDEERERTGYDVLLWLEREVAEGRMQPPAELHAHSGNTGAIDRMEAAIHSIRRFDTNW
jgi:hypothetical protein